MEKDLILTETSISSLGQIFVSSGYFKDTRDASQAIVKILAGRELGLPPIASMTGIHIVKGKVQLSATTMATVLKRHGSYDYRVIEHSNQSCKIEFFQDKESVGISEFTMEDAKLAGLIRSDGGYKKYPRNMLFARAMSNGVRWFCAGVLGGPVYVPGELVQEDVVNEDDDDLRELADRLSEREEVAQKVKEMSDNGDDPDDIYKEIQAKYDGYDFSDIVEMME